MNSVIIALLFSFFINPSILLFALGILNALFFRVIADIDPHDGAIVHHRALDDAFFKCFFSMKVKLSFSSIRSKFVSFSHFFHKCCRQISSCRGSSCTSSQICRSMLHNFVSAVALPET